MPDARREWRQPLSVHLRLSSRSQPWALWRCQDNDGSESWKPAGWMITDQTATQQHVRMCQFPAKTSGNDCSFDPGESIFVTGTGTDVFIAEPTNRVRPQFHLHS